MVLGGGLEPPRKTNKNGPLVGVGTHIGTHDRGLPPELIEIVDAWEGLPRHVRFSVLTLVRSVKRGDA